MGLKERKENRRKRREARAARKAAQAKEFENKDPLEWYNAKGQPMPSHPLRDLWRGNAGFLVCGGPSINTVDYKRLGERGICSLAINNVSGYVPVTAMTFSDPPEKFHYGVLLDPCVLKFVPKAKLRQKIRLRNPETREFIKTEIRVRNCPSVFGYNRSSEFWADKFLTSTGATCGNNDRGVRATGGPKTINSMLLGFRLMHYLGVRRVFLLGVDFGMSGTERQAGNYAFAQAGSPRGNNSAYKVLSAWLGELAPIFAADGMEVFNCNPESRLTVFPHVPFEEALENCRYPVPPEPFDLEGWYEESEDRQKKKEGFDPDA